MNRVSAPVAPPSRTTSSRLTASKHSNLTRSWPPSAGPHSLDHSLQVYLQTRPITASMFARSLPPSASPNSLDYGLQVRTITASKCISELARSAPPSVSPNPLGYSLQIRTITASELARSRPWSASLSSLDHSVVKQYS